MPNVISFKIGAFFFFSSFIYVFKNDIATITITRYFLPLLFFNFSRAHQTQMILVTFLHNDMLWSLACNIAKRLLFETNNIASTVNMNPSSFYSISTISVCVCFFYWFFPYFILFSCYRSVLFCVIYFSHLYISFFALAKIHIFHQFIVFVSSMCVCMFSPHSQWYTLYRITKSFDLFVIGISLKCTALQNRCLLFSLHSLNKESSML